MRLWVRFYVVNNYWKMVYYLSEYFDVYVVIDFLGLFIVQFVDYMNGKKDIYQIIIEKIVNGEFLIVEDKWFMFQVFGGFFDYIIFWNGEFVIDQNGNLIRDFWDRYIEFKNKMMNVKVKYVNFLLEEQKVVVINEFIEQDYIDLVVFFNFVWIDYDYIMNIFEFKVFYEKVDEGGYMRDDVKIVFNVQFWFFNYIFEEYEKINYFFGNGNVEVIVVFYVYLIGLIFNDFGWESDFDVYVKKFYEFYKKYFGDGRVIFQGGWVVELVFNDKIFEILVENGWQWVMIDQFVFDRFGVEKMIENYYKFRVVEFNGKKIYLFFCDYVFSDCVGFIYSGMNQYQVVQDFVNELLKFQKQNYDGFFVYVVIFDGENFWEYYLYDGKLFFEEFYKKFIEFQNVGLIKMFILSEYIKFYGDKVKEFILKMMECFDFIIEDKVNVFFKVKSFGEFYDMVGVQEEMQWFELSWIDGMFFIWIGEFQENYGWYWFYQVRKVFMENKDKMSQDVWNKVYEYFFRVEVSDWFWWYGNDQDSGQDYIFDCYLKIYFYEIYKLVGVEFLSYFYGNYFFDGQLYIMRVFDGFGEGDKKEYLSELVFVKGVEVYFEGDGIYFFVKGDLNEFEVSFFSLDERIGNMFIIFQKRLIELRYLFFLFLKDSVGMLIMIYVVYKDGKVEVYKVKDYEISEKVGDVMVKKIDVGVEVVVLFDYFFNLSDFYFVVLIVNENGELEVISLLVEFKFFVQVKGVVIVDIVDFEGDDYGFGIYIYLIDLVFKLGVFDFFCFRMFEQVDSYVMEFYFKDFGGNLWNGLNGFSFQIIEVYFDFKEGGNSSVIKMFLDGLGSNVNFDLFYFWDVVFRIVGWDYGNLIVFLNGIVIQGEMQILVDLIKNLIVVKFLKKYFLGVFDYGFYVSVFVGLQDGYGLDKWRLVVVEVEQWKGGGVDLQVVIVGVVLRVYDMFVLEGFKLI